MSFVSIFYLCVCYDYLFCELDCFRAFLKFGLSYVFSALRSPFLSLALARHARLAAVSVFLSRRRLNLASLSYFFGCALPRSFVWQLHFCIGVFVL